MDIKTRGTIPPVSVPEGSKTSPAKATERADIFLLNVTYGKYL